MLSKQFDLLKNRQLCAQFETALVHILGLPLLDRGSRFWGSQSLFAIEFYNLRRWCSMVIGIHSDCFCEPPRTASKAKLVTLLHCWHWKSLARLTLKMLLHPVQVQQAPAVPPQPPLIQQFLKTLLHHRKYFFHIIGNSFGCGSTSKSVKNSSLTWWKALTPDHDLFCRHDSL